ncbi:hypothetical protein OG21DRAFT_648871 [Imleria badia]|nr:hypothetical protein OG21DRAFT_648871 [Imleria badia]
MMRVSGDSVCTCSITSCFRCLFTRAMFPGIVPPPRHCVAKTRMNHCICELWLVELRGRHMPIRRVWSPLTHQSRPHAGLECRKLGVVLLRNRQVLPGLRISSRETLKVRGITDSRHRVDPRDNPDKIPAPTSWDGRRCRPGRTKRRFGWTSIRD